MEEFLELLLSYSINCVADVRRFPKSKFPHFSKEELQMRLKSEGIEYFWLEGLGGYRRRIFEESPNKAIRSEGFRNYADYMLTEKFKAAVEELIKIALEKRTAIMCAEKLYWKCHRKFISDYLVFRGFKVIHILDHRCREHVMSKNARVTDFGIIYDAQGDREIR